MTIEEAKMMLLLGSWDMEEERSMWLFTKSSALITIRKAYHITAAWYWPGPVLGHEGQNGTPFKSLEDLMRHIGLS